MLKNIKTYFEYGNRFCGVEHTSQNGKETIYTTLLKKAKNAIDIETAFEADAVEDVVSKLPKKQHVFLVINDDNVLTKRVESEQNDTLNLVYSAFPNINLDDFYYQVIHNKKLHFVSICRKAYVHKLIEIYKKLEVFIIDIGLGNTIASSISGFINSDIVSSSNANILIENNAINTIEKAEIADLKSYNVNGLEVTNSQLLSFSSALDTVIHNFQSQTNFDSLKQSLKNNFKQSRFHNLFLKFGLVFILSMLLINFFFFNYYFEAVNTLQQTSQVNQTTKQKILELNESVNKSQKLVDDMLKSSASKSSFYVNTIVQSLPNSILLSELNYQPLLKRIKADKPIEIETNTILIIGESNHSESFSKWMTTLEAINWINKVEILGYKDFSKSNSNFKLKLNITNE